MLADNTERLITQFETEHQALLEQARLRREQQEKVEQAARERAEEERRRPPTPGEIASVEAQAKPIVRQKFDVDPNAPGWPGLVLADARKLLSR